MRFIDSHCHLNFPDFDGDRYRVLSRALEAGVQAVVLISTSVKHIKELRDLIQKIQTVQLSQGISFPEIYYSIGMHPADCKEKIENLEEQLRKGAADSKMIGFGETGLDYYHTGFNKVFQKEIFETHLGVSCATGLPVIVHSRSAENDTVEVLKAFPKARGVIHCFTGSREMATACLDLGFYISFSGIVTFKNALSLQEIATFVPLDRILIETDAPYLAPIPYRGKRNEPAFLRHTLDFIADLKKISSETLAVETTKNFFTLFNKAMTETI